VATDKAGPYLRVLYELVPAAAHVTEQYGNSPIESDHARLKARLRPMRGLKSPCSAARIAAGHAFMQNVRRGHYELATEIPPRLRVATAFTELARAMWAALLHTDTLPGHARRNRPVFGDRPTVLPRQLGQERTHPPPRLHLP
jgi:hypothetical protein